MLVDKIISTKRRLNMKISFSARSRDFDWNSWKIIILIVISFDFKELVEMISSLQPTNQPSIQS